MPHEQIGHWMRCPDCGAMRPDVPHLEGCGYDGPEPTRIQHAGVGPGVDKWIGVFVAFALFMILWQIGRVLVLP